MTAKTPDVIGGNDFAGGRNLAEKTPDLPTDYVCEFEHPRQHRQRPEGLSGSVLEAWQAWTFDCRNPEFFEEDKK